MNLNHLDDLLRWFGHVPLEQAVGDVQPFPLPELWLVVEDAVRVIIEDEEIVGGVEKDTRRALVVTAPVLMSVASHVGLAVAEAMAINGNEVVFCLCRVWLENNKGNIIRLFVL